MTTPLEIFCCYAREDQEMLDELKKHLMPLQREGQIKIWSDTDLNAGAEWEKELHQHLESADIVLLLISPDFMSSDYCYSTEMKRAIERHEQDNLHIIPILLRATFWRNAPFAKLQMVPTNAKPVRSWPDRDDAFNDITEHIHRLLPQLQIRRVLAEASKHFNEGHFGDALACYEQVLHLDPANGKALFKKAEMLYWLDKFDASIETFTLAEQIAPAEGEPFAYVLKAEAFKRLKRYSELLATYDKIISFEPNKAIIYADKAMVLIDLQAYDQALSALEQARRLNPNEVSYCIRAGNLLFRLRRFEQALVMYKLASKLEPGNAEHYAWQGRILLHLQRPEDALAAYKQALTIAPQVDYYEQGGKICLQLTRLQEALEMYEQALASTKEEKPYLLAGKGQAFLQLERYDEALTCYQSAIKLSAPETDPQFYHDLGTLYERLAQHAYATEQQRRAVWQPVTEEDMFLVPAFDPAKLTLLRTLNGHKDIVQSIAISPDGKILASGSNDGTTKLWELPSGRELLSLTNRNPYALSLAFLSVAFSPDGKILASGSLDHTIKLWELPSGRELFSLTGHTNSVYSVAFSPDGKTLASGSYDGTTKLWELLSGHELLSLTDQNPFARSAAFLSVAFSPDGKTLVSASNNHTIKLWNFPFEYELPSLMGHTNPIPSVAFSPDGKTLASGSSDKTIKLWELPSGRELLSLTDHTDIVMSVAFSPDGAILASGSKDHTIKLWEMPSGRKLRTLTGHTDPVYCVTFSPDGKLLASSSEDGRIKLWGMESS
jgi:WD40 repeat protein/predicted negative regulator of RcsB-dependent stress response